MTNRLKQKIFYKRTGEIGKKILQDAELKEQVFCNLPLLAQDI